MENKEPSNISDGDDERITEQAELFQKLIAGEISFKSIKGKDTKEKVVKIVENTVRTLVKNYNQNSSGVTNHFEFLVKYYKLVKVFFQIVKAKIQVERSLFRDLKSIKDSFSEQTNDPQQVHMSNLKLDEKMESMFPSRSENDKLL